jgi:hypothetical protein
MLNTKELSPVVQSLKETFGEYYCFLYDDNGGFVTSDCPIRNIYDKESMNFIGDDFLCFPISSTSCIVFCDEEKIIVKYSSFHNLK